MSTGSKNSENRTHHMRNILKIKKEPQQQKWTEKEWQCITVLAGSDARLRHRAI